MGTGLIVFIIALSLLGCGEANALCVKAEKANIRVGPGTNYQKGWTVYKYFPLKKVGVSLSGDWYAVEDIDGDVFWAHKGLVTNGYRCAAVKCDRVNVRSGPGAKYRKRFSKPAEKYDCFKVLERKGAWMKVKDANNNSGWIHQDCVQVW